MPDRSRQAANAFQILIERIVLVGESQRTALIEKLAMCWPQAAKLAAAAKIDLMQLDLALQEGDECVVAIEQLSHCTRSSRATLPGGGGNRLGTQVGLGAQVGQKATKAVDASIDMARNASGDQLVELAPTHAGGLADERDRLAPRVSAYCLFTVSVHRSAGLAERGGVDRWPRLEIA